MQCGTNGVFGDSGPSYLEMVGWKPNFHLSEEDLLRHAGLRVIDGIWFLYNQTKPFHHLTKLLADGLIAYSSLVQIYNLVPEVLQQLLVVERLGCEKLILNRCASYTVVIRSVCNWLINKLLMHFFPRTQQDILYRFNVSNNNITFMWGPENFPLQTNHPGSRNT